MWCSGTTFLLHLLLGFAAALSPLLCLCVSEASSLYLSFFLSISLAVSVHAEHSKVLVFFFLSFFFLSILILPHFSGILISEIYFPLLASSLIPFFWLSPGERLEALLLDLLTSNKQCDHSHTPNSLSCISNSSSVKRGYLSHFCLPPRTSRRQIQWDANSDGNAAIVETPHISGTLPTSFYLRARTLYVGCGGHFSPLFRDDWTEAPKGHMAYMRLSKRICIQEFPLWRRGNESD